MTYANVIRSGLVKTVPSSLVDLSTIALVRVLSCHFPRLTFSSQQFLNSVVELDIRLIGDLIFTPNNFLGRGRCVAFYKCDCDPGWAGASCALPDCAGVNQCFGQGECMSSNTCQCYPGFQGVNCSEIADCASLGNCSGNGVCMQEKQGGDLTCR